MNKLDTVAREGMRTDIPEFAPGDTLRVMVRVREGDKERLQAFEGVCTGRRGGAGMISLTTKTRAHIQTQIKLRLITLSLPKRAK